MAAFYLTNQKNEALIEKAKCIFHKRGLNKANIFETSSGTLLLYSKQMIDVDNYVQQGDKSLYCIGSPIYKGLSYYNSLNQLITDLIDNSFSHKDLFGEFVLLYDNGVSLNVITDTTGMYKLFTDAKKSQYLTSSFMAAAASQPTTFNRIAIAEQFLYGFIAEPDTLVNEVCCIQGDIILDWLDYIPSYQYPKLTESITQEESVKRQVKCIENYMKAAKSLTEEFGSECGLSGGCDSRLIYTAVNNSCTLLSSVHTHQTSHIHDNEISVVEKLAKIYDTPLNIVSTTYLPDCKPGEIERVLRENTYYFDARNADTIGGMSQTHTRDYKKATTKGNGVTFSGIGGEIYRDFYYTQMRSFDFKKWLKTRIFDFGRAKLFEHDLYQETISNIISKIERASNIKLDINANPIAAKRYFDCYRIPFALSNVVHANNQMSFFLAPFTEAMMISAASTDFKYQDHCGLYEGRVIDFFNSQATALPTSRGYNLRSIPQKVIDKWNKMSKYPYWVWRLRYALNKSNSKSADSHRLLLEKSRYYQTAYSFFRQLMPEYNDTPIRYGEVSLNSFVFSVCSIYEIELLNNNVE